MKHRRAVFTWPVRVGILLLAVTLGLLTRDINVFTVVGCGGVLIFSAVDRRSARHRDDL